MLNDFTTAVVGIDAVRLLQAESPSKDAINSIKDSIINDPFYGVSIESLNTIASYATSKIISDDQIRLYAYDTLQSLFIENNKNSISSINDKRIISALLITFPEFTKFHKKETLDIIRPFVSDKNWYISRFSIARNRKNYQ